MAALTTKQQANSALKAGSTKPVATPVCRLAPAPTQAPVPLARASFKPAAVAAKALRRGHLAR